MNQKPTLLAFLLLFQLAAATQVCRAQQPVIIPPGPATPLPAAQQSDSNPAGLYYKVTGVDDHLKMVVNSSRFLVLDKKIPQVQVNNPDILDVVPISPSQVQISAKKTGVTQVNLWGEDKRIYTVNVIVMGDASELTEILRQMYPKSALTIVPIGGTTVIISGYVDQQEYVPKIVATAATYFPSVINNMRVSGAQQAVLHVKVIEVSRTKLRNMGFDWAQISSNGNVVWSGVSGLLTSAAGAPFGGPAGGGAPDNTFKFSIGSANAFYGVLNALRQDSFAKLLSEPDLVAISGRPAYMQVGGEIGYQVTSSVAGNSVGWKEYGTRLDFVPVVLGNGRLHVDLRSRVSEPDEANSIGGIPAIKTREVETGVELRAGQTLAIAGLLEQRVEATNSGLPWISEVPYLGLPFRNVSHTTNEVELIVLITPQIVDGMEPGQVPACLPGSTSGEPTDWQLFFKGQIEVPACCPDNCAVCPADGASWHMIPGGNPNYQQNPQIPNAPNQVTMNSQPAEPGFIGPVGYDVLK